MAAGSRVNFKGQQRVDVPHLRLIEAGVAGDLDTGFGGVVAGGKPYITRGYYLISTGAVGLPAEKLRVAVGGGIAVHYLATASGSVFKTPDDRIAEILEPTNPRLVGGFTPGQRNFVGLDFVMTEDPSTADVVQFFRPDTAAEVPEDVPLLRTAEYRIVVSTTEFSATPGICPVALVDVDSNGYVVSTTDARQLLFRSAPGGSAPADFGVFGWPGGRLDTYAANPSIAGDRAIRSLRDFVAASTQRIQETGGGPYWFSPTADRNVRLASTNPYDPSGTGFQIVSGNIHWRGLRFVFDNSPSAVCEISDQLTDLPGLTDLSDGQALYVDLDRLVDRFRAGNPLRVQRGVLRTLGTGARPGTRWVIAWNIGGIINLRDTIVQGPAGAAGANGGNGLNGTDGKSLTFNISGVLAGSGVSSLNGGIWMGQNSFSATPGGAEWPIAPGLEGTWEWRIYIWANTSSGDNITVQATVDGSLTGGIGTVVPGGLGTYTNSYTVPGGAALRRTGLYFVGPAVSGGGIFGATGVLRRTGP
jgi:hypothetical protein